MTTKIQKQTYARREFLESVAKRSAVLAGLIAASHLPYKKPEVQSFFGVRSAYAQATPTYSTNAVDFASALNAITLTSYSSTGGTLDALRIASGPGAFGYAIGLPEPSTWAMIFGLVGMVVARFAWRRRRTG